MLLRYFREEKLRNSNRIVYIPSYSKDGWQSELFLLPSTSSVGGTILVGGLIFSPNQFFIFKLKIKIKRLSII